MPPRSRLRQGLRALLAFSRPVDRHLAAAFLSPDLLALFDRLQRSEQLHSLNVLRTVLAQGPTPPDLAAAALLHDVGKSRCRLAVWQKTLAVLVRAFAPGRFRRWADSDPARRWAQPFAVAVHHPAWGAEMLAAAGASETTVWLAAHHADDPARWAQHPDIYLLQRLQRADDAN